MTGAPAPNPDLHCACCGQPIRHVYDPAPLLAMLALPPIERKIAERLMLSFGRWVQNEDLLNAMYADHPDYGPSQPAKNLDVRIYYLRARLVGTALWVESGAGRGYGGRRMAWREPPPQSACALPSGVTGPELVNGR